MNTDENKTFIHYRLPTPEGKVDYGHASQQHWEEFLQHIGYEANQQEKEANAELRHSIIEDLLASGKVYLAGTGVPVLPGESNLTCADLIKEGTWTEDLCCSECHTEDSLIGWFPDRWRHALGCCHVEYLREKWLVGQEISQEILQTLHDGTDDPRYPGIDVIKQLLSGC